MKEYIIEIENENVVNEDTLNDITEALNTLGIRLYVYEKEQDIDPQGFVRFPSSETHTYLHRQRNKPLLDNLYI